MPASPEGGEEQVTNIDPLETYRVIVHDPGNYLCRRYCVLCEGEIEKGEIAGLIDEPGLNRFLDVCNPCMDTGAEGIAARLIERAKRLEADAAELRADATATWHFPTAEERQEATRKRNGEWEAEWRVRREAPTD